MTDKENIIQLNKPPMSDARMKCFSDYTPVRDIEIVNTKHQVWKGNRVIEEGTPEGVMTILYFRRRDKRTDAPKLTELETLWPEIHIHDATIIGYEFWLIPKIKMLFGYDPPSSTIIKAPMQRKKAGPFGG